MNPRQRRLEADHRLLVSRLSGSPYIDVYPTGPAPPERYRLVYRVPGIRLDPANRPVVVHQHLVDVVLPAGYPREKPYAVALEPVFHPNFGAHICLADFWSPSQSLLDVVLQIADMLQYRRYNIRSPLNAVAAEWAARHFDSFPVGNVDLVLSEVPVTMSPTPVPRPGGPW